MTGRIEILRALQQRIRESKGVDRELDLEICKVFGIFKSTMKRLEMGDALTADNLVAPHYTTDPDGFGACVALQRSVLPKAYFSVERAGLYTGMIPGSDFAYGAACGDWGTPCRGHHDSIVHAALLAIIAASIAKLEKTT
jgi:hypothetical protein